MDISLYLKIEPHMTNGMSLFQMDKFVIEDQITPYRKLKQAVMEARARLENITSMGFDLEELKIKREQAISKRSGIIDSYELRLCDVQINRYQFEIDRKQSVLDQQQNEVEFFNGVIKQLVATMFGSEENMLKQLQDPDFHQEKETEFWTQKLTRGVMSDLVNYGTISKGVLEAVDNLPIQQQKAILGNAAQQAEGMRILMGENRDRALALKDG